MSRVCWRAGRATTPWMIGRRCGAGSLALGRAGREPVGCQWGPSLAARAAEQSTLPGAEEHAARPAGCSARASWSAPWCARRCGCTSSAACRASHLAQGTYWADAIRFATSEYLHGDWRLMHARHCGRPRSHCCLCQGPLLVIPAASTPSSTMTATTLAAKAVSARAGAGELGPRTLVLRSTHSSQLNVGLLRFCFFLAGVAGRSWAAAADVAWALGGSGSMAACRLTGPQARAAWIYA